MAAEGRSYRSVSHWRLYESYLPEHLRIGSERPPVEEFWEWRGSRVHCDLYLQRTSRATVVLAHGAGGYGRLLAPFARILYRLGYSVVAPDLPGYGLTEAKPEHVSYGVWADCLSDLVDKFHRELPGPVVLCGFSIGGYLAYLVAAKNRRVAGVAATTLADPQDKAVQRSFARHPLLAYGLPLLPMLDPLLGGIRVPVRWLSNMRAIANDPGLVDVFLSDEYGAGARVSLSFLRSIFSVEPEVLPEDFDSCPVLLAHPAQDLWTPVAVSMPFFERLGCEKELVLLENCGHFPVEEPGLSQLTASITHFLERVSLSTSAQAAGA